MFWTPVQYNERTITRGVLSDEIVLTDGVVDPAKLRPITFDPMNNAYLVLGEKVGNAFADGAQIG